MSDPKALLAAIELIRAELHEPIRPRLEDIERRLARIEESIASWRAPEPAPELVYATPVQFAKRLGVSASTVRKRLRDGLPHKHVGTSVRIPIRIAEQWLDQRAAERRRAV